MSYNIETTPHFEKELKDLAKRYKSMKQDFGKFKDSLKALFPQHYNLIFFIST
jgi:mRNA-degrading endonuclease RelE of RelBE toxin-antitoxin system